MSVRDGPKFIWAPTRKDAWHDASLDFQPVRTTNKSDPCEQLVDLSDFPLPDLRPFDAPSAAASGGFRFSPPASARAGFFLPPDWAPLPRKRKSRTQPRSYTSCVTPKNWTSPWTLRSHQSDVSVLDCCPTCFGKSASPTSTPRISSARATPRNPSRIGWESNHDSTIPSSWPTSPTGSEPLEAGTSSAATRTRPHPSYGYSGARAQTSRTLNTTVSTSSP